MKRCAPRPAERSPIRSIDQIETATRYSRVRRQATRRCRTRVARRIDAHPRRFRLRHRASAVVRSAPGAQGASPCDGRRRRAPARNHASRDFAPAGPCETTWAAGRWTRARVAARRRLKRPQIATAASDADLAEHIAAGARALAMPLAASDVERLVAYVRLLERWNATYNLIGDPRSARDASSTTFWTVWPAQRRSCGIDRAPPQGDCSTSGVARVCRGWSLPRRAMRRK